jgi:hypothetical protein
MMSFNHLPPELRLRILEFVISSYRQDVHVELSEFPLYQGISKFAAVNREWQTFIESANFRRIRLDETRLADLERVFGGPKMRRMKLVSHIYFTIELPEPDQVDKWTPEKQILKMQARNSATLSRNIGKLFTSLSRGAWRLENTRSSDSASGDDIGVTLEIALIDDSQATDGPMYPDVLDTEHGLGRLRLDENMSLPRLDFVRRLCLPAMGTPSVRPMVVLQIARRLKGLTHLVFERIGDEIEILARDVDDELAAILPSLPPTLRYMSFFEEPREFMPLFSTNLDDVADYLREEAELEAAHSVHGGHSSHHVLWQPRLTTVGLVRQLLQKSLPLEQFAASFWVDAVDFLHPFLTSTKRKARTGPPPPMWPNLRTLTLTAFAFRKQHRAADVNRVLGAAAQAALRMPKLRTLEIYNIKKGRVDGVFRYTTSDEASTIRWESPWPFKPSDKVRNTWSQVAKKYTRNDLACVSVISAPTSPYFEQPADAVPLQGLATRTSAVYEMTALAYSQEWLAEWDAEQDSDVGDEEWETDQEKDSDEDSS